MFLVESSCLDWSLSDAGSVKAVLGTRPGRPDKA